MFPITEYLISRIIIWKNIEKHHYRNILSVNITTCPYYAVSWMIEECCLAFMYLYEYTTLINTCFNVKIILKLI